jgi:hypothetical protein
MRKKRPHHPELLGGVELGELDLDRKDDVQQKHDGRNGQKLEPEMEMHAFQGLLVHIDPALLGCRGYRQVTIGTGGDGAAIGEPAGRPWRGPGAGGSV